MEIGTAVKNGEETLEKSNLDTSELNAGSVAIIKNGEIHASVNQDKDSIKNNEETKNG